MELTLSPCGLLPSSGGASEYGENMGCSLGSHTALGYEVPKEIESTAPK